MTGAIADAYDRSADAWRRGPARLYAQLADALLDRSPGLVRDRVVLDAAAGTGAMGDAARKRGAARVVSTDLAPAMLSAPAVVADLVHLPFHDGAFDLALAGFVLGHLSKPEAGLRELRRVAAGVVASAFAEGWSHPAKRVVEQVLAERGYRPPDWYVAFKEGSERYVGDPARLISLARATGYAEVRVEQFEVTVGAVTAGDLVAWRLGMAHHAPFLATLSPATRDTVRSEAERELADAPPLVVPVLGLIAT